MQSGGDAGAWEVSWLFADDTASTGGRFEGEIVKVGWVSKSVCVSLNGEELEM